MGWDWGSEGCDQGTEGWDQRSEGWDHRSEGWDQGSEGWEQRAVGWDRGLEGWDQGTARGIRYQRERIRDQRGGIRDQRVSSGIRGVGPRLYFGISRIRIFRGKTGSFIRLTSLQRGLLRKLRIPECTLCKNIVISVYHKQELSENRESFVGKKLVEGDVGRKCQG